MEVPFKKMLKIRIITTTHRTANSDSCPKLEKNSGIFLNIKK